MTLTITSPETRLERLRTGTHVWPLDVPVAGELVHVEARIENGVQFPIQLPHPWSHYFSTSGELIATPGNLRDLIPKYIVDLQLGLATQPMLYTDIYRTITDANLPQVVDVAGMMSYTGAVFLERAEGEEIHYGHRERGQYIPVPLRHFALGFEWTEELIKFDQTWRYQETVDATTRAHSALLNRLHLRPIIEYPYVDWNPLTQRGNVTRPTYTGGANNPWEAMDAFTAMYNALGRALYEASLDINQDTLMGRFPTLILTHSSNRYLLESVLGGIQIMGQPPMPALSQLTNLVLYDDYVIWEGERGYRFVGVPTDRIFLIEPGRGFIELVKEPLNIEQGEGDFSRYVAAQMRAGTWRGVVCAPEPYVHVLMMPPQSAWPRT